MTRAALYARFSTDKQTETSIEDQRRCCQEYAKKHALKIVQEFSDLAISGAAFGNRPGAMALSAAALNGEFDVIVVADLTRLSRSNSDLSGFLDRMRFRKIRVVGVLDQFDSTQRSARMQAGLSGIMSDEYRAAIGERVHLAMDTLAKSGKSTGGNAYGYEAQLKKHPVEARRVAEIFRRVARGETMKSIVVDFNKRGIASPGAAWRRSSNRTDGKWMVSTLNALLQNELYVGRLVWNRSQWIKDPDTGKRCRRERPREEWVVQERPELAIVDRKTFDVVAAIMERRRGTIGNRGGGRSKYVLSGLLECALCGARFVMSGGGRNGRGYGKPGARYYVCSTFQQGGVNACKNTLRVPRELAEERLLQPALSELLSPESVAKAIATIKKYLRENPPPVIADTTAIVAKIEKVRALVTGGVLEQDMAEPIFAKLEAEKNAVLREAQRTARAPLLSGPWGIEAEYRAQVAKWREDLAGQDADVARTALQAIYGPRIRLHPNFNTGELSAEIPPHADAVLAAVGGLGRISLGSGGPQPSHIPLIRKGRK